MTNFYLYSNSLLEDAPVESELFYRLRTGEAAVHNETSELRSQTLAAVISFILILV